MTSEMELGVTLPDDENGLTPEEKQKVNDLKEKVLDEMTQLVDLLEKLKKNIEDVSDQIQNSFRDTRIMYWSIFILGIGLVLAAVPVAVLTKTELFSVLFGSVGVIDILAFFLKDPPQQLQKSRANLSKLQAAYYQWLVDATNWSVLLYNLSKSKDPKMGIDDMKKASDSYIASFSELMRAIDGGVQDKGAAAK
jgi:hypothetical protein